MMTKQKAQFYSFKSDLPFRIYVYTYDTPQENYQYVGTTPGEVEIPIDESVIVSPLDLGIDLLESYTREISSQEIKAVYLTEIRDNLLETFCKSNAHIRHIILDSCGWNLAPIETLGELEFLEIHNNAQVSSLSCIERLPLLKGLVITSCNNVFSRDIPTSESLEQLLLFNIAKLVRLEEIIECLGDKFPNIKKFHLNNCGSSDVIDEIEISHLRKLKYLQEFQAAGTPVVNSNSCGHLYAYYQERQEISGYLDKQTESSINSKFHWEFTHNNDLLELHKKAPEIRSLELNGCRDIDNLALLSEFTMLESLTLVDCLKIKSLKPLNTLGKLSSLTLVDCPKINSLEPLNTLGKLRILTVNKCSNIEDYLCLTRCRTLEELEISQGDNGIIPLEVYTKQLADLHIYMPQGCSLKTADVTDIDLELLIEKVPQFLAEVKEELQCSVDCPCQHKECEYA